MKSFNYDIGKSGEELIIKFLIANNYSILCKNFRFKRGEIDIIAKHNNILCFIEVKSRFNFKYGTPMESISHGKKQKIINTSKYYIHINNLYDFYVRYDVAEVYFYLENYKYKINYLEDAFRLY